MFRVKTERRRDLADFRKPLGLPFAENQFSVCFDLEDATTTRDQICLQSGLFLNFRRHTVSLGTIVSSRTVSNAN